MYLLHAQTAIYDSKVQLFLKQGISHQLGRDAVVRFECENSAIDVIINFLWKIFHKPTVQVVLTTTNFEGFSNFCRYYTRSQTGKSTRYRPTLKPLYKVTWTSLLTNEKAMSIFTMWLLCPNHPPTWARLLTLPEHMSSPPVFSGVPVTRSWVLYVCFVDRCLSFCTFFFWPLCCLFFFDIYRFWLHLGYLDPNTQNQYQP